MMVSSSFKSYFPPPSYSSPPMSTYQNRRDQGAPLELKLAGANPPPPCPPSRHGTGKWTLEQLRASDAIIPLQSGTNQFASQRGMTGFGRPRNTTTPIYGGLETPMDQDAPRPSDAIVPLQYGTNQFASQRGMTGFGVPRDVTGKHLHRLIDEKEQEEYN